MACAAMSRGEYLVDIITRTTGAARCTFRGGSLDGKFTRVLDGTSEAELNLSTANGCCPCIPVPRVDELRIRRIGENDGETWIGPVTRVVDDHERGLLTIYADDRSYWWQGAPVLKAVTMNDTDPVAIGQVLLDAMTGYTDLGPAIPFGTPEGYGITIDADIKYGESAWDLWTNYAKSLLDFTVVGSRLIWGGREIPIEDGPALRQSVAWSAGNLVVDRDATAVASRVRVQGAGGLLAWWPPEDTDNGYGRRTLFVADTNLNSEAEATEQARFIYEANKRPSDFLISGGGTLGVNAPVCMYDLIPGRKFPIAADDGCLATSEVQRLSKLVVEFGSGVGCDGRWAIVENKVAIDLQRAGSQGTATRVSG